MAQKVEWIIKGGSIEKKRFGAKQPGLDLTRATFDILKHQGHVVTNDCCTYFPSFPELTFETFGNPTSAELADIPTGAIFINWNSDKTLFYLFIKGPNQEYLIHTNN